MTFEPIEPGTAEHAALRNWLQSIPVDHRVRSANSTALEDTLTVLINNPLYHFAPAQTYGNESFAYEGIYGTTDIQLRLTCFADHGPFDAWAAVDVGFGQVRHMPWANRTPMADRGMVRASSEYRHPDRTPAGGSALPGYELIGLKWRTCGAVAPRSRTSCSAVCDGYVQVADIVEYLVGLAPLVAAGELAAGDIFARAWDAEAVAGW